MDMTENMPRKNGSVVPILSGLAGAVLGAGLVAVAGWMVADKRTKDKVYHTLTGIGERAREGIDKAREGTRRIREFAGQSGGSSRGRRG